MRQVEPALNNLIVTAVTRAAERTCLPTQFSARHLDAEDLSGGHKALICNATGRGKQDETMGKIVGVMDQPACGLNHTFEHENARQDWKCRKMFSQILFGQTDGFDRDDSPASF